MLGFNKPTVPFFRTWYASVVVHVDFQKVKSDATLAKPIALDAILAVGSCFVTFQMPGPACEASCADSFRPGPGHRLHTPPFR